MIHYDPHLWLDHLFDIRGTLVREISGRVGACVLWAIIVVSCHYYVRPLGTSVVLHSLVGVALGLLLVFRTNSSYDRYWEGRRLWGSIVNETRNLIRGASVHFSDDHELLQSLTRWTAVFPWAVMSTLRGESKLGPAFEELSPDLAEAARNAQHPALLVAQRMTGCLLEARQTGSNNRHHPDIARCEYTTADRLSGWLRADPQNASSICLCRPSSPGAGYLLFHPPVRSRRELRVVHHS